MQRIAEEAVRGAIDQLKDGVYIHTLDFGGDIRVKITLLGLKVTDQ